MLTITSKNRQTTAQTGAIKLPGLTTQQRASVSSYRLMHLLDMRRNTDSFCFQLTNIILPNRKFLQRQIRHRAPRMIPEKRLHICPAWSPLLVAFLSGCRSAEANQVPPKTVSTLASMLDGAFRSCLVLQHPLNVTGRSRLGKGPLVLLQYHNICRGPESPASVLPVRHLFYSLHSSHCTVALHHLRYLFWPLLRNYTAGPNDLNRKSQKHLLDAVLQRLMPQICKAINFRLYTLELKEQ